MTKGYLWKQASRTARALSLRRVTVYLDEDCLSSWEWATGKSREALRIERPRSLLEWGYFIAMSDGTFKIGVNPGLSINSFYWVILHETAHAYLTDVILPDHEAAANELASIWAVSVARRYPVDEAELMQWLERLESYHESHTDLYLFSAGANHGRMIPNAALICSLKNNRAHAVQPMKIKR